MAERKKTAVPILRIKKGDSLQTIYAKARRAFTAADLQKYTEIEEGIPARQVLAELEALDREETRKHRKKSKNDRAVMAAGAMKSTARAPSLRRSAVSMRVPRARAAGRL
jgi:hypothetical protein